MDTYSHLFKSVEKEAPIYYEKALKNLVTSPNTTPKVKNALKKAL